MIIVAESGSTKTDWVCLGEGKIIELKSSGINPLFLDKATLTQDIKRLFSDQIDLKSIKEVHFYGPGTSTEERADLVKAPLTICFPNATINVNTDLLAASRALFQEQEGIACILGTGSNSGLYNGKIITKNIPSLGFILGDEGSGAHLGLSLLKKVLNHELELDLEKRFYLAYNTDIPEIIDKVYKQNYPNRFLASFTPFLLEEINQTSIKGIVRNSFESFIQRHILPYKEATQLPIGFVGSVAYYFKDILIDLCQKHDLKSNHIIQKPMNNLVKYHSN